MKKEAPKPETMPATGAEKTAGEQVTEHIRRCPDGMYRWYYELSMLKNPVILFTTWKVLGISFAAVYLFVLISSAVSDALYGWRGFLDLTWIFLLVTLGLAVLSVLAYLLVAAAYGWRYVVLFEMDDKILRHIQVPRQFKKAQALTWLTMLAGAASKSPTTAAAGLLAATKNSSTSELANVRRIVLRPKRNLIKLKQTLEHNQVYAAPEDYEFVRAHLTARCGKASIR